MKTTPVLFALALLAAAPAVRADCGKLIHHDEGGDYTNPEDRKGLGVVEQFHFTPSVENLVQGSSDSLGGDIGYTLDHFPNHHRALAAMAKLSLRDKTPRPHGAKYTVECYFERAMRLKPDDATVRMIYGSYLLGSKQEAAALTQLREAGRLAPDNPNINYNLGLLYVKRRDYVQARFHARKAYALGFPLPGLKNKLAAAGQWNAQDAPEASPAAGAHLREARPSARPDSAPDE